LSYQSIPPQGKDVQSILNDPARLATEIKAVKDYLGYLEESQRMLYPAQAPVQGRTRRNKPRPPMKIFASMEERVLYVVGSFTEKYRYPPTMREIKQRTRKDDTSQSVKDMVESGLLKELPSKQGKSMCYAATELTLEAKQRQDEEQARKEVLRKERENQERQGHESMAGVLKVVQQLIEQGGPPSPSEVRKAVAHLPYWGDAIQHLIASKQMLVVTEHGKGSRYVIPD
jgi:hypothetical protein